jgi:DNA polymerase
MDGEKSLLWVGISMQKDSEIPLDKKFASGKLIQAAIDELPQFNHHRANLVNFAPLDKNGKLRYPTKKEISESIEYLLAQIEEVRPQIILALGGLVVQSFSEMLDMKMALPKDFEYQVVSGEFSVMPIHHPSYILIYKRKKMEDYINGIVKTIQEDLLTSEAKVHK